MFKLTNADSMIILLIILCELIIMMALLFHLQSKARKMEKAINILTIRVKECEKQNIIFTNRLALLEKSIVMLEVRERKRN